MKQILLFVMLAGHLFTSAQITTPVIKARFGVDGELRANFFNSLVSAGNDDWFNLNAADTSGKSVIDTSGAAAIVASYLADVSPWPNRMKTFFKPMSRPPFSIVNNRLWLDAMWIRDYHGNDTTVFTSGSDKNGMSPVSWTGGVQSIPDKNDILDIFVHIRRAGPNRTDSLWLFGGISLDNTTGNRYFDFEMYQTDIYYDRVSGKWFGYGPDAGHTSWEFDASGNITRPGDIIFSAEYQSSTLSNVEARIWVSRTNWQTVVPTAFNWSGQFDGASAGAAYGYASILPKTAGAFYFGLGSQNNTWAGPFRVVLQNNALATNYTRDQFMEFGVNLSKLGLDPVSLLGGDICGTPFNRIVVKTRSSASFTSELKDFVAPTDLFLAPRAEVETQTPYICDTGSISNIYVRNPVLTSVYEWSTPNGNIVGPTTGVSIVVDTPGTYIVIQRLQADCAPYASDTIQIFALVNCEILSRNLYQFDGHYAGSNIVLEWKVLQNNIIDHFIIEQSNDGVNFSPVATVVANPQLPAQASYSFIDSTVRLGAFVFYRIILAEKSSARRQSHIIHFNTDRFSKNNFKLVPNPGKGNFQLQLQSAEGGPASVSVFLSSGKLVWTEKRVFQKGMNVMLVTALENYPAGLYHVLVQSSNESSVQKLVLIK
jgi:hypothetical protein